MSLGDVISSAHKEIAGSRTKNRLTVQISYAIQLIMEFYSIDFLVMMDYIEDVSIICNPSEPSEIHLYQVKTKSSDKQYQLSTVISEKWYQKLYDNTQKYGGFVGSASVVCNTDVVKAGRNVFLNTKSSLEDEAIKSNIIKIKELIAKDHEIDVKEVDLSKYFFLRSTLSTKGHKEEVEHQFENFLLLQDSELQVATVKSIYKLIYNELDEKFNNEINEDCTDIKEIFDKKGVDGQEIKDLISCGLAIQIPSLDKLFSDYAVTSVLERKHYSSCYRQIKMDMYSNMTVFVELKKTLQDLIYFTNIDGIDEMSSILSMVYLKALENNIVPEVYQEEYYLKMLIMILIHKYCYGGEV